MDKHAALVKNRYLLRSRLGLGSSSEVYAAVDTWRNDRPVALKILHRAGSEAGLDAHLRREFAHLFLLQHPHLPRVEEFGILTNNAPLPHCDPSACYLVEELVPGIPAHLWAPEKSPEAIAHIGAQTAAGLAPLHQRGLQHGDIKPDNLLVTPEGHAKVVDFGMSRSKATSQTGGTPRFMAPEALAGAATEASDLYSLGITLSTLLDGAPPTLDLGAQLTSPQWGGLLGGLTHPDPARRTTAPEAFEQLLHFVTPEASRSLKELRDLPRLPGAEITTAGMREALASLEGPTAAPATQRWVVSGAPGVGKTTAANQLVAAAVLKGYHCPGSVRPALDGSLSPLSTLFFELGVPPLSSDDQWELFAQWAEALETLCALAPLALIWDDVPEGSPLSEFGEFLTRLPEGPRLLWVQTQPTSQAATLQLSPLSEEEVARVLRTTRPLRPQDAESAAALTLATHGHPGSLISLLDQLPGSALLDAVHRDSLPPPVPTGEETALLLPPAGRRLLEALIRTVPALLLLDARGMPCLEPNFSEALELLIDRGLLGLSPTPEGPLLQWRGPAPAPTPDPGLAAELFEQLPHTPRYLAARGRLAAELNAPEEAGSLLLQAASHSTEERRTSEGLKLAYEALSLPALPDALRTEAQLLGAGNASALGLFEEALTLFEATLPHPAGELGAAETLLKLGQYDAAATRLRRFGEQHPAPPPKAHLIHARACLFSGALDEAAGIVREAQTHPDHPHAVELVAVSGLIHFYRGELPEAQRLLKSAYNSGRALSPDTFPPPVLDATRGNLAMVLQKNGELQAAEDLYRESLTEAQSRKNLPKQVTRLSNIGTVLQERGEFDKALETYTEARTLSELIRGQRESVYVLLNRANLQCFFGQSDPVIGELTQALSQPPLQEMHTERAYLHLVLADAFLNQGHPERALEASEEAHGFFNKTSNNAGLAECLISRTQIALFNREKSEAVAFADQAMSLSRKIGRARILHQALFWQAFANLEGDTRAHGQRSRQAVEELEGEPSLDSDLRWMTMAVSAQLKQPGETPEALLERQLHAQALGRDFIDALKGTYQQSYAAVWYRRRLWSSITKESSLDMELPTRNVDKLLAITRELTRDHNPARLLERIIDAAIALSGAERGFLILRQGEEDTSELVVQAARNIEEESLQGDHLNFSRSIAGHAIEAQRPITTMDALGDERFSQFSSVHHLQLRSVLCLPLHAPPSIEGALYLDDRRRINAFSQADVAMLSAFGDQAAIALSNARLVTELQGKTDALEDSRQRIEELNQRLQQELLAQSAELERIRAQRSDSDPFEGKGKHGMLGKSAPMRELYRIIDRVSDKDVCVTILGESGTGKELVARGIHSASGRAGQFVSVNCGAITPALWESELFGHERGSFTGAVRSKPGLFEIAHGGTLFLDEVGELPLPVQVKLLRVLQQREFRRVGGTEILKSNARIVCATNRNLQQMVTHDEFREDLWYRINVVECTVSPLRERREDLPVLIDHFVQRFGGASPPPLSRAALTRLLDYRWPGNVRELENEIQRAIVLCEGSITPEDFSAGLAASRPTALSDPDRSGKGALKEQVAIFERELIIRSLHGNEHRVSLAARSLGLTRAGLYKKISKYGIVVNK